MHVCQMIDAFTHDGAQRVVVNFAHQAAVHGVKVSAIGLMETESDAIWNELKELDVNISLSITEKLYDPVRIWHLARELRAQKVDVIQSHLSYANILAAVVGRVAGIPVVSTLHTANYRNQYYRAVIFRTEMAMLRFVSQGVIAVAGAVREVYGDFIPRKKIRIFPNPVIPIPAITEAERSEIRGRYLTDPHDPLLISVGRLTVPKGYSDLIDAFSTIQRAKPQTRLIIAGSGKMKEELENKIRQCGLSESVFLLGERSDVPALLAAGDLYLSASHWEGMPLSILEAMSAGLPVIATAVGGVPEILEGNGILVAPRQPESLACAAIDLLDSPTKMSGLGRAGRAFVSQNHAPGKWFEELIGYFQTFF